MAPFSWISTLELLKDPVPYDPFAWQTFSFPTFNGFHHLYFLANFFYFFMRDEKKNWNGILERRKLSNVIELFWQLPYEQRNPRTMEFLDHGTFHSPPSLKIFRAHLFGT